MDIQENVPLAPLVHYRIGGAARYFAAPESAAEFREAATFARDHHLPVFILGGGTNLLMADGGFAGMVIRPHLTAIDVNGTEVRAGAGATMAALLDAAAAHGLSGLEWAGGLPGSVGGAVRGNAGAFGGEIKDSLTRVASFDIEALEERERTNAECRFGYRASVFKELGGKEAVLFATFSLRPADGATVRAASEEKMEYRKVRHPLEYPNVGSVFKNVPLETVSDAMKERFAAAVKTDPMPVVPTAALIAAAGLQGTRVGNAEVSRKHPNFVVNLGGATAEDVEGVIAIVKKTIKERFGIDLEEEIQRVA